jgi:hypothetical protein
MASPAIQQFCDWLQRTPLSEALQTAQWIVPAGQTVHILSVAIVISSALFFSLRLLDIGARDLTVAEVGARFVPVIWWTLPVLLVTGATLIIAEPARALQNSAFWLKMGLLLAASLLTIGYELPLRRQSAFWTRTPARAGFSKLFAVVSLALWSGVIIAGRFIAYIDL